VRSVLFPACDGYAFVSTNSRFHEIFVSANARAPRDFRSVETGSDEAGGVSSSRSVFSTNHRRSNTPARSPGVRNRGGRSRSGRRLDTVRRRARQAPRVYRTRRERFGLQGSAQSNVSQDARTSRARDAPKFFFIAIERDYGRALV
jgi:hypothetical protein